MAEEPHTDGITTFTVRRHEALGGSGTTLTVNGKPKVGRIKLEPDGEENVKVTLFEE